MLWNASAIIGFDIEGTNGLVGTANDILFDDKSWTTKWIVVHTGPWLFGRKVLVPLVALGKPDHESRHVAVQMTKQQIKESRDFDIDLPVSRHIESHAYNYYDQNVFWHSGFSPMGLQPPSSAGSCRGWALTPTRATKTARMRSRMTGPESSRRSGGHRLTYESDRRSGWPS